MIANVEVTGRALPESDQVRTRDAPAFIAELQQLTLTAYEQLD
jgi:hypothetical protein